MDNDIYNLIANNIKHYRKKLNYTQMMLAEKSGYSHEFIRRIEAPNMKKYFSIETIFNLSKALNIDVWRLFSDGRIDNMDTDAYTFYDQAKGEFEHYLATTLFNLSHNNLEYIKLNNYIKDEFKKYPNVEEMIYGNSEGNSLSKEEAISLKKVLDYKDRISILEEKEIFFKGFKECYNLVNKIKNIDDKHTE